MPQPIAPLPWRLCLQRLVLLASLTLGVVGVACDGDDTPATGSTPPIESTSTGVATVPSTDGGGPVATATTEPTPTATATPDTQQRLRTHLLSGLTTQSDPALIQDALEEIEVISHQFSTADPELWLAVTSGTGIWELPGDRTHVAAVYELRPDETWVEVSSLPLASAPTVADIEAIPTPIGGNRWFAIHGVTGAHSGTFELLSFDGVALTSTLWWFSPSPGAGLLMDINGDGIPEVVLDATDPYVYCYACGVRLWNEVIYRWTGEELMEVSIAPIPHTNQLVTDLTEQAALFAHADLWRRATEAASLAVQAAPDDAEVEWLHLAISRIADARLVAGGSEAQPFLTWVLAGEYKAAELLMRASTPEAIYSSSGPLIAGTSAEGGWEEVTGQYLVDFATRAIDADPNLAAAYAVRSLGHILVSPDDWATALMDMEAAQALVPSDAFYDSAVNFLLEQNGGASG